MSPEHRLLLYSARLSVDSWTRQQVQDFIHFELDWTEVVHSAYQQGIAPLLYINLRDTSAAECIPHEALERLKGAYYGTFRRNLLLYDELRKVIDALKDQRITPILLKGAALAEGIYRDIGLRPMADLDLLIDEGEVSCVHRALSDMGYTRVYPPPSDWHMRWREHLPQYKKARGGITIILEIHLSLWASGRMRRFAKLDLEDIYEHAVPLRINGSAALMLGPEDLLQHLCLHTSRDLYETGSHLIQWRDIACVQSCYHAQLDWGRFVRNAERYGVQGHLYNALRFVEVYLGPSAPEEVMRRLGVRGPFVSPDLIAASIMKGEPVMHIAPTIGTYAGRHYEQVPLFLEAKGLKDKARWIIHTLFPRREYIKGRYAVKYPGLVYLYYLVRMGQRLFGLAKDSWSIWRHYVSTHFRSENG